MKLIAFLLIVCIFSFSGCGRPANLTTNSNNSSTPTATDQKPPSEPTPETSPPTIPTQRREPSTKFANFRIIAAWIQKADKVRLFEGLPHQEFAAKLLEQELKTKKTVNFQGFPFYEELLELKEADAKELTLFFRDRKSFKPYWGPKGCGGFHPDYCVEWQVGQESCRALICFGCGETMLFGPNIEIYCDIAEKNGAQGLLWKLLEPYQKNRPGPRVH